MRGKYTRKKQAGSPFRKIFLLLAVVTVAAAVLIYILSGQGSDTQPSDPTATNAPTGGVIEQNIQLEEVMQVSMDLGYGLEITDIASYTGIYMEDGSDEVVSGILMIVVKNNSEQTVQYAEITLADEKNQAQFSLSTLLPGASVVLLEQNRMLFDKEADYSFAAVSNVAVFDQEPTMMSDRLTIQALDGAFNVTNISDEDITGDIYIYYKNSSSDMFYGGITYRAKIQGGLGTGEIAQVITNHFSVSGSTILFVTVSGDSA